MASGITTSTALAMRTLLKRSFLASCAYYLADNVRSGARFRRGEIETTSGMAHAGRSVESSLAYIDEVFGDYKRYSRVSSFAGSVAEIGPGDNCGVGLMFLSDGCTGVDLVDRFYSKRDEQQNADVYRALIARHPSLTARFGAADACDEGSFDGLRRRYGDTASAEEFFSAPATYDVIASRAVMEHVYDPILAIRRMADALRGNGLLLHKVDLRDHGMFTPFFHELKFLEVPDALYAAMTRSAGRPNRVLVHRYRQVLRDVLPNHEILVTRLAGAGDIEPHVPYDRIEPSLRRKSVAYVNSVRARFARSLRDVSDEDLSVAGIFIVARKAASQT
jgi:SAM-dependent methyltransferase